MKKDYVGRSCGTYAEEEEECTRRVKEIAMHSWVGNTELCIK
jgi:hypothetical protein